VIARPTHCAGLRPPKIAAEHKTSAGYLDFLRRDFFFPPASERADFDFARTFFFRAVAFFFLFARRT
jgi:hypothetical protein